MTTSTVKEDLIQEQILQAAKRLFAVHGLSKVTMDDVARAIGKGRSSLYYYYKSKDEIFDAVVSNEIREMISYMRSAVNEAVTTQEKIQTYCVAKLEMLREKKAFFSTLDIGMDADALSNFNKVKILHHQQIVQQESILLKQIIDSGIKEGHLREATKKEQELQIFVLLSCLHGIKREMRLSNDFENIEAISKTFTSMIINGLAK